MAGVLVVKYVIIGIIWTIGWCLRFAHTGADVSVKNLCIVLAPWIVVALYFLLFWWG